VNVNEETNTSTNIGVHAPRKLTFSENVVLTLKLLAILGCLGAAIWGIEIWTAAR
jgi:hypothetical protein